MAEAPTPAASMVARVEAVSLAAPSVGLIERIDLDAFLDQRMLSTSETTKSLDSFRAYSAACLKRVTPMREAGIAHLASKLQNVMVTKGMNIHALRDLFQVVGSEAAELTICGKLAPFLAFLPSGITAQYVSKMISEFICL
jgi:hypothetical protein